MDNGTAIITGTINSMTESDLIMEAVQAVRAAENVITKFRIEPSNTEQY